MNVRWHELAEEELIDAADWYETRVAGLGERFLLEAQNASTRAGEFPDAWARLRGGFRRILLDHFPWALVYAVDDGEVVVLALHHTRVRPARVKARLRTRRH